MKIKNNDMTVDNDLSPLGLTPNELLLSFPERKHISFKSDPDSEST